MPLIYRTLDSGRLMALIGMEGTGAVVWLGFVYSGIKGER